jgi:hypothetical protein
MLAGPLHAGGVVVWKEQAYHADASAKALWFDRMESEGPVTWFHLAEMRKGYPNQHVVGSRKGFENHQPFRYITVDQRPALELMRNSGLPALDEQIGKLAAFARQYPAAAPLLAPRVQELDAVRRQYGGGTIFHEGRWMPIAEYEQLKARRDAAEVQNRENAARQAQIDRQAAMRQRANWLLGGAAGSVLLLVAGMLLRLRWLAWSALLVLLCGGGWLTWSEGGYGWLRELEQTATRLVRDPPWR